MEKLVIAHRLHRPPTSASRIVENRELDSCPHGLTNPLYSFIIATAVGDGLEFDDLIRRFVEINRELRRLEIVWAMCVLGVGTVHWFYFLEDGHPQMPLFMGADLHETLHIGFESANHVKSAFYALVRGLMLHLYHSVLAPEDIAAKYGPKNNIVQTAKTEDLTHNSYARPNRSQSTPWDYEVDFWSTGEIDRVLGAHKEIRETGDPRDTI
jgi:hypothetical protein